MPVDAIIVVAFGPRRVTTEAVERAKALAAPHTDVVVVPAIRQVQRALGTLRSPRVRVIEAPGRAGLETALARPEGDTVLFVHDDVLLTKDSLEAMLAVHQDTAAITSPWTNDVDQPNSVGSLPVARLAEAAVTSAATNVRESVDLEQVRPSCLVGTAVQLRRLLPHRLSVARTLLRVHGDRIVAAAHAVAAHDSTCVDGLVAPASPNHHPLVTAAMIVRDEEENIGECLRSLEGFADRIVVCDTGSVDRTIEIVREHGAEVIQAEWRDDFAWARNQVLEQCRESWYVLQIDADERLSCDPEEIRRLLATDVDDSVGFTVRIDNVDAGDRVQTSHLAVRLFRPAGVHYVGALHEMPMRNGASLRTTCLDGLSLTHTGYRQAAVVGREKFERNAVIARQGYEVDPGPLTALHYARSLIASGGDDRALAHDLLAEAIDGGLAAGPSALALSLRGRLALDEGEVHRALDLANSALQLVPADDGAGQLHAEAGLAAGRPDDVITRAAERRQAHSVEPYTSSTVARAREMLAVARAHIAIDDLESAAAAARDAVATGFLTDAEGWLDVVSILVLAENEAARQRVIDAASTDRSGHAIEAIAETYPSAEAAAMAVEVVAAGGVTPGAVRLGLVGAVVAENEAALDVLAPHVELVGLQTLEKLIDAAARRGWQRGAEKLAAGLLAGV